MNGGLKFHCGACFNEWQPGPTTFCPRCGATTVLAGPSPRQGGGGAEAGISKTILHAFLIIGGIFLLIFAFGFAGCSRLFVKGNPPSQSR